MSAHIPVRIARFGAFIRDTRKGRKISGPDLATNAGISKGTLSKIENGGDVQLSTVVKICDALNITVRFIDNQPVRQPLPL